MEDVNRPHKYEKQACARKPGTRDDPEIRIYELLSVIIISRPGNIFENLFTALILRYEIFERREFSHIRLLSFWKGNEKSIKHRKYCL